MNKWSILNSENSYSSIFVANVFIFLRTCLNVLLISCRLMKKVRFRTVSIWLLHTVKCTVTARNLRWHDMSIFMSSNFFLLLETCLNVLLISCRLMKRSIFELFRSDCFTLYTDIWLKWNCSIYWYTQGRLYPGHQLTIVL